MRDGKEKKEKRRKRERKRKVRRREKRSEEGKIILEKRAGEHYRKSEFQKMEVPKMDPTELLVAIIEGFLLQLSHVPLYICLLSKPHARLYVCLSAVMTD
jgi:hypothetical protein